MSPKITLHTAKSGICRVYQPWKLPNIDMKGRCCIGSMCLGIMMIKALNSTLHYSRENTRQTFPILEGKMSMPIKFKHVMLVSQVVL